MLTELIFQISFHVITSSLHPQSMIYATSICYLSPSCIASIPHSHCSTQSQTIHIFLQEITVKRCVMPDDAVKQTVRIRSDNNIKLLYDNYPDSIIICQTNHCVTQCGIRSVLIRHHQRGRSAANLAGHGTHGILPSYQSRRDLCFSPKEESPWRGQQSRSPTI